MAHDPEWVQSSNQPATDEFDDVPVWLANEPPEATAVAVAAPAVVVPATGGRAAQTNWADPRTGQEAVRRAAQQAATDAATAQVAQSAADAAKDLGEMPRAWLIMRIANPIVAVLILACVIGKLDSIDFFTKFDAIVICVYLIIFSLLLCCFELCETISIAASILAENFGFLCECLVIGTSLRLHDRIFGSKHHLPCKFLLCCNCCQTQSWVASYF